MTLTTEQTGSTAGLDLAPFTFTRRCWVDASPGTVYDLVSDVSRIELWSPSASRVSYDSGDRPRIGARITGTNRRGGREWTSSSEVVAADPGARFAFVVGGAEDGIVRWTWDLSPHGPGTVVAQTWRLLRTDPVLGSTPADLYELREHMADSAERTLIALAAWIAEQRDPRAEHVLAGV